MVAGTEMAALDFNHNVNRSQVIHGFIVSQILNESLVSNDSIGINNTIYNLPY